MEVYIFTLESLYLCVDSQTESLTGWIMQLYQGEYKATAMKFLERMLILL